MKITAQQVDGLLQKLDSLCSIFIYGKEDSLVRDILAKIKNHAVSYEILEMDVAAIKKDPASLADAALSIGLFGDKSLLIIRNAGDFLAKIIESISQYQNSNTIIAIAEEAPPSSSMRKLHEAHSKMASIAIYEPDASQIPAIIRQKLTQKNIEAEQEAILLLQDFVMENNLSMLDSELEKISLYLDGEIFSAEDANLLLAMAENDDVEELVMLVADKNYANIIIKMEKIKNHKIQPITIIRYLLNYFFRLLVVKNSANEEQVIATMRPPIFFKKLPIFKKHVKIWSEQELMNIIARIFMAEKSIKLSNYGDMAYEILLVELLESGIS